MYLFFKSIFYSQNSLNNSITPTLNSDTHINNCIFNRLFFVLKMNHLLVNSVFLIIELFKNFKLKLANSPFLLIYFNEIL